jgi:hypothetical protein
MRIQPDLGRTSVRHVVATLAVAAGLVIGVPEIGQAQNAVTDWVGIVQPAIHSASAPRPPGSAEILHTIVHLAVHDAVVAIEGGYEPFAAEIDAPAGADLRAAIATAAYRTARGRVAASQFAYLDGQHASYMAGIPDGQAKDDGVAVGEAAAMAMLALRASDGFNNAVVYQCSAVPPPFAEFEPNAGCGTQPVDAKVAQITPFTFDDPGRYRLRGPDRFRSRNWVDDFDETKDYGRSNSAVRTAEQTDIVYFWAEHAYVHWNRNLNSLAVAEGLDTLGTARLFALVHTAVSDAVISGFHAKYSSRFVRPRTAIPRAAEDGNRRTEADASWTPLLTVNHPEYPSAHAFWSTALTGAVASFFGDDDVPWTITTSQTAVPQLVQTERTYADLDEINDEIDDARVWAGLHWRNSMTDGRKLSAKVTRHVLRHFRAGDHCHE